MQSNAEVSFNYHQDWGIHHLSCDYVIFSYRTAKDAYVNVAEWYAHKNQLSDLCKKMPLTVAIDLLDENTNSIVEVAICLDIIAGLFMLSAWQWAINLP